MKIYRFDRKVLDCLNDSPKTASEVCENLDIEETFNNRGMKTGLGNIVHGVLETYHFFRRVDKDKESGKYSLKKN